VVARPLGDLGVDLPVAVGQPEGLLAVVGGRVADGQQLLADLDVVGRRQQDGGKALPVHLEQGHVPIVLVGFMLDLGRPGAGGVDLAELDLAATDHHRHLALRLGAGEHPFDPPVDVAHQHVGDQLVAKVVGPVTVADELVDDLADGVALGPLHVVLEAVAGGDDVAVRVDDEAAAGVVQRHLPSSEQVGDHPGVVVDADEDHARLDEVGRLGLRVGHRWPLVGSRLRLGDGGPDAEDGQEHGRDHHHDVAPRAQAVGVAGRTDGRAGHGTSPQSSGPAPHRRMPTAGQAIMDERSGPICAARHSWLVPFDTDGTGSLASRAAAADYLRLYR
jgi:hypothetical protein